MTTDANPHIKNTVKAVLDDHACLGCIAAGFQVASLIWTRMMFKALSGEDSEEVSADFLDLAKRAQSAMLRQDKQALAMVALEAGQTFGVALESISKEDLQVYVNALSEQIKKDKALGEKH